SPPEGDGGEKRNWLVTTARRYCVHRGHEYVAQLCLRAWVGPLACGRHNSRRFSVKVHATKTTALAFLAALGGVAAGIVNGCSRESAGTESPPPVESTGGVALQLAAGEVLDSVGYNITGPGGFTRSGSLPLAHSATVSGTISGIPAGAGYTITLTGTSVDGS